MSSQIDDNFENTSLAVTDDVAQTIAPLLVDPVTGRLEIMVAIEAIVPVAVDLKIDENYQGVAMAVTDDASADIKPLRTCNTHGELLVDILIE